MARGRMISKSLSTSEKFAGLIERPLAEFSQLLYTLILPHTDDFGRLQGDPFTVKHQCFPASGRSLEEFADALMNLHEAELIIWYQVGGKRFVQVTQFEAHQTGLHKRTRSACPRVPGNSGNVAETPAQLKGREENLREENLSTSGPATKEPSPVPALLAYYHDGYLERIGEKPNITAKDGATVKRLVGRHGPEAVKERIDALLDSTDPFIAQSGRTIGVLSSCWNKLRAAKPRVGSPDYYTARDWRKECAEMGHSPACPSPEWHQVQCDKAKGAAQC